MAKRTVLEFERPIFDLEQKIEELRRFGDQHDLDVAAGIEQLERQIAQRRADIYGNLTPYQRVQLARHPQRPYALDYIEFMCTDFLELHGDRRFGDDLAVVGGFARLDGRAVMMIGQQKGRDLKDNIRRNFGLPHPEGYRKALRLMKLAELARAPIVCLIDTAGAAPDVGSEERHVGEAIAVNLREMFTLEVPVVAVVIGEGGSGGALGISVGNRIYMLENAYYSVITPEGCAAILWKESNEETAAKAAAALKLSAPDLVELGICDGVVPEPEGGANNDPEGTARALRELLGGALAELCALSVPELLEQRYEKYRRLGAFHEGTN